MHRHPFRPLRMILVYWPLVCMALPRYMGGGGGGGVGRSLQAREKELDQEEEDLRKRQDDLKKSLLDDNPKNVKSLPRPEPARPVSPDVIGAGQEARAAQAKRRGISKTRVAGRLPANQPTAAALGGTQSLLG